MNHIVLARKWRPKKFADLVGQNTSVTVLQNIINSGRLHHAYLLTGTRGVGKTTIARIIAKALNCLNLQDAEPCLQCSSCTQIEAGYFVDVIEIDAASNTGVDNIRELIETAQYTPTSGKYKIYIIDEVHMLSKSAFNAMLKTLEEPPAHAIFILATTDLQKVPITVLSRCLQLKLRNLLLPEIEQHLAYVLTQEQIQYESSALAHLAIAANGSMRDALSLLDQAIAFTAGLLTETVIKQMLGITEEEFIFELLDALSSINSAQLINTAKTIYTEGHDLANVLQSLSQQLCNISLIQLAAETGDARMQHYAKTISVNDIQLYFEIVNLGLEQLSKVNDKYPIFIMTLLRMLAFRIGSPREKDLVMQTSNFSLTENKVNLNHAVTHIKQQIEGIEAQQLEPATSSEQEVPKTEPSSIAITEQLNLTETTKLTKKKFDGDWFSLIKELESSLGPHLHLLLANSQLVSHTDNEFKILVDSQYETGFNQATIHQLAEIFSGFFKRDIQLTSEFAGKVNNTLKEQIQFEKEQKQLAAEAAILADGNLNRILTQFSATITPGSIKPV
jgi:DNA polymerase-3 subunit gamma/tau